MNNRYTRIDDVVVDDRHRQRALNADKDECVMAIHTGLSVTVAGHRISIERDEVHKVAWVVVKPLNGYVVSGLEGEAIKAAAALLRQRAERFLGDWKVIGLPNTYSVMASAG